MEAEERCPECGADWNDGKSCRDHFGQMLAWDFEQPSIYGRAHHLTVLSYHLQHPRLYSPEALEEGKRLLVEFLDKGVAPQEIRRRDRAARDSGNRGYRFAGTEERHGSYAHPLEWSMRAPDVTAGGRDSYVANVEAWARSILSVLRTSGNLAQH